MTNVKKPAAEPEFHGDAATVVLLRDSATGPEVLLLERLRHKGSFAGAWVFPGGYVDPEDRHDDDSDAAARRAGARETFEETGLRIGVEELVHLSVWLPPASAPKRLRTWFFLAHAPDAEVVLSPDEHLDHLWMRPADLLERHGRGEVSLVTPTWVTLHGLAGVPSVGEALSAAAGAAPETFRSRMLSLPGGGRAVAWDGDAEYDAGAPASAARVAGGAARHRLDMSSLPWVYSRTD
ncbi:NUDIX hydrolase [Arthrobacter sp. KK5.5]|uniref:NUDIX hydrolase n=1 Tax=Arthrobacter sp. KK5.5 TaxID=3373084 RepID=UPI003EE798A9